MKYKIVQDYFDFRVNSFESIWMHDPFPDEDLVHCDEAYRIRKSKDTLVYPERRMSANDSPPMIFIPNMQIMFKLMRACIGVKDPKDLWFNYG